MAADRESRTREQSEQDAERSGSAALSTSETRTQRGDRQRSIERGQEPGRSAGVARRPSAPVYGSSMSPFIQMRRMMEDMDRMFERFGFGPSGFGLAPTFGSELDRELWRDASTLDQTMWTPQVETFRRGDKLVVRADLPGLTKDDVRVEVEDGVLTLSGERTEENEENRGDVYRSERSYGRFYRAIPLPEGVTDEQCDATFKDGVLEVTLPAPKQPERKARQIPIRS